MKRRGLSKALVIALLTLILSLVTAQSALACWTWDESDPEFKVEGTTINVQVEWRGEPLTKNITVTLYVPEEVTSSSYVPEDGYDIAIKTCPELEANKNFLFTKAVVNVPGDGFKVTVTTTVDGKPGTTHTSGKAGQDIELKIKIPR